MKTKAEVRNELYKIMTKLVRVPVDFHSPVLTELVDYVTAAAPDKSNTDPRVPPTSANDKPRKVRCDD